MSTFTFRPARGAARLASLVGAVLASMLPWAADASASVTLATKGMTRESLQDHAASERQHLKNWAFLVGITKYDEETTGLDSLQYPGRDVDALREVLIDPTSGLFNDHTVRVAKDKTTEALKKSFREFCEQATAARADTVLFFFSGHGLAENETPYLLASDADAESLTSQLSFLEVMGKLENTGARQRVAFIDACRVLATQGPGGTKAGSTHLQTAKQWKDAIDKIPAVDGWACVTAASDGQVAYEDDENRHGVFAHYLIQGLGGAADGAIEGTSPDFRVQLAELVDYLEREVYTRAESLRDAAQKNGTAPRSSTVQQPEASLGGDAERIVLGTVPVGFLTVTASPWARIESVTDPSGSRFTLPEDDYTPARLACRPGRYRVTLTSVGGAREQREVSVTSEGGDAILHWNVSTGR